jgi:hypothetical protein
MRTKTINLLLIFSISTFFIRCSSDDFKEHKIGNNLIDETTEVILVDTFTVESSTVILDSLITSRYNSAILGGYNDEYLGNVKTEYYGVVSLGSQIQNDVKNKIGVSLDSLAFIMYTNGVYLGDTLQPQRLIVNRLKEKIELSENERAFYGHSKLEYDSNNLLNEEFYLKPVRQSKYDADLDNDLYGYDGKGIYFKLDTEEALKLGDTIVKLVNARSEKVQFNAKWLDFFNGIVLRSDDLNSSLYQASLEEDRLKLRLYCSDTAADGAVEKARFYDFPVVVQSGDRNLSFTNYSSDRSETPQKLDRLVEQEQELSSSLTDGLSFIQGGIGLYTKINFPHLENLNLLGLTGGILKAELIMYPKDDSYDDEQFLLPRSNFNLYNTNEDNVFGAPLPGANNSSLSFSFVRNFENEDESYYSVDLTSYVNSVLLNGKKYDDALLIGIPFANIGNSFDRLIIENDTKSDFRIRLKVTYVIQR